MTLKKKGHPKFNIPDCGARNRSRVKPRWRKQRGIDNKKRVKKDFAGASPSIGYRNSDAVSGMRADGNRMMLVRNANELQAMIEKKSLQGYAVTIAKGVSERKRMLMTQIAQKNGVKVTNGAYE